MLVSSVSLDYCNIVFFLESGGHSECTVHTVTVNVGSDPHRHVTEVTYDIGKSGSHSKCTVHTVTLSVGSDSHIHVTEVTYDIGTSGSHSVGSDSHRLVTDVTYDIGTSGGHSECTVNTVTVSVGRDHHRHVTEVTYAIYSVSFTKRFHFQHSAATPFLHTCTGTFAHPTFFGTQREYHSGSMER